MKMVWVLTVALVLLFAAPALADTVWTLDYLVSGDISQTTHFYGDGTYLFWLINASTVSVFLLETNWISEGLYGDVALPSGFPPIIFPPGAAPGDQIVASPVPGASVAEPGTLALLSCGLGALLWWRRA
jgi:hypothetical protein